MYQLQLDLKVCFCPPMTEKGFPLRLTRTIELPFPPTPGLALTGSAIDEHPMAEGFKLEDLTWDMDRNRFTADISTTHVGFPIAEIPDILAELFDHGWRFGSYADDFDEDDECENDQEDDSTEELIPNEDEFERLQTIDSRKRPKEFNKLFRGLIRTMCEVRNNLPVAYAMWKTGKLIQEEEVEKKETPAGRKFADAVFEFEKMSFDAQWDWQQQICKTYPRLDKLITPLPRHRTDCKP